MSTSVPVVLAVLIAFFVLNAIVIRKNHVKQESVEEFAVGGRGLGWILVCFSYVGAWYVGAIYVGWIATSADIGIFAQYLGIYSIGGLIIMYMMSSNVWTWGKVYKLDSIASFIKLRYKNPMFAKFFAVVIIAVDIFWLIVEMVTIGYVVSVATNGTINFAVGTVVGSAFVVAYTFIGGARASAVGNMVQGVTFGILGTIIFFFLIWKSYGGIVPLFDMLEMHKPELLTLAGGNEGLWMSSILTGILGAYVWPQIFNKIYMTSGPMESKKAVYVAPVLIVITTFGILWNGLGLQLLDGAPADHQYGLFWIANQYGGPVVLGLVGVFAVAASMSTISGTSHACGVMIGEEFLNKESTPEEKRVRNVKTATISLGILGIIIAVFDWGQLNFVALAMYEFVIQGFVPLFMGVMWKRGNVQGAFLGMAVGVIIALCGFFGIFGGIGGFTAGCIGLFANFIVYIVCAYIFGKQDHVDEMWESLKLYDQYGNLVEDK